MSKTKIEYVDQNWNIITGCRVGCEYCYARKMNNRYKWQDDFSIPIFHPERLIEPQKIKEPSTFLTCTMGDIAETTKEQMESITTIIERAGKSNGHRFLFLTKKQRWYDDTEYFPDNVILGHSTTAGIVSTILHRRHKNLSFVSIEPLLDEIKIIGEYSPDWIVVGGLSPKPVHKKEWVDNIIKQARQFKIPIFLKNNLHYPEKIQEFPSNFIPHKYIKER